jgi:predicted nucleotidyltransferase
MPTQTDFAKALSVLNEGGVQFIVVGGVAAILHGLGYTTYDLDVVYDRDPANIRKLTQCLEPHSPYLRGAPPGLPFKLDERAMKMGLNFTLVTSFGDLDLLGEVAGVGGYRELLPLSNEIMAFGIPFRRANLEPLIRMKRAAGRPKDFEILAQLEALLEERRKAPHSKPDDKRS